MPRYSTDTRVSRHFRSSVYINMPGDSLIRAGLQRRGRLARPRQTPRPTLSSNLHQHAEACQSPLHRPAHAKLSGKIRSSPSCGLGKIHHIKKNKRVGHGGNLPERAKRASLGRASNSKTGNSKPAKKKIGPGENRRAGPRENSKEWEDI